MVEIEVLNLAQGKVGQSNRLWVLKENKHPGRNPDLVDADVKTFIDFSGASLLHTKEEEELFSGGEG